MSKVGQLAIAASTMPGFGKDLIIWIGDRPDALCLSESFHRHAITSLGRIEESRIKLDPEDSEGPSPWISRVRACPTALELLS